jgi:hypothetical protein
MSTASQGGFSDEPEDLSEVMDFSDYDLKTTIRLIVLSGESRRIDVNKGSLNGSIYIKEGEVYRAETVSDQGDEAFFAILSWKGATHSDSKQTQAPETNVKIPTAVFLDLLKNGT